MYHDSVLEIAPASNGFIVKVCKPIDEDTAGEVESVVEYNRKERTFVATDVAAVSEAITALLPLLAKRKEKDDFDTTFEELTNE